MEFRTLRYFTAVVEEGTISAAARKLHMQQPPLSMAMKSLEEEYHIQLFKRGARQITLTDAGSLLYRYAQQILELESAADEDLTNLSTGHNGTIRLGLVSTADSAKLYRGIRFFHLANPGVSFRIYEGNTYDQLDMLRTGRTELAVIRTPFQAHDLEELELERGPFAAAGQTRYLGTLPPASVTLDDLQDCPLILYRRWENILRDEFRKKNLAPDILCMNDDARTSIQWARAGLGVALVPSGILRLASDLETRILAEEDLDSPLCLVRRRDAEPSLSAGLLWKLFQTGCSSEREAVRAGTQ